MADSASRRVFPHTAQQSPAENIRKQDVEDRLSRLDTTGPAFSSAIDQFQVVAGAAGVGVQMSFRLMRSRGLESIIIVRNFSLDQRSADQVKVFPVSGLRSGCLLTHSDQDSRLSTQVGYYWLKLIPLNKALRTGWLGPSWAPVTGILPGTVTSVGLTMPAEFSVSGSPVTSSGTLAVTKALEAPNTVWAGPSSGVAAVPSFRALVPADLPAGYRLLRVLWITSSQTYTPTAGARALFVECVGGGGAGGGAVGAASNASMGGGGGAGCYACAFLSSVLASYTATIGAGGAGASGLGSAGGATSLGSVCSAAGGQGANTAAAGTTVAIAYAGWLTPTGTGDFTAAGGGGANGFRVSGTVAWGGMGGASFLGAAGRAHFPLSGTGQAGNAGAGGGGACALDGNTYNGGSGGAGVIRIWELS
jgi:hypothetical protein